jgi:hypothetical protein
MFTQLLSQPPRPLNKARSDMHFGSDVERVIMKGLAKSPNDRYPDVRSFASDLKRALEATPSKDEGGLMGKMKGLFKK